MIIMLLPFVMARRVYLFLITRYVENSSLLVGLGYPVGWVQCCIIEVSCFVIGNKKRRFMVKKL